MKNGRFCDTQIMGILKQAEGGVPVTEMRNLNEQNKRLKKMHAELSMQNDLLKEDLGKRRGPQAWCPRGAGLADVFDQRDLLSL